VDASQAYLGAPSQYGTAFDPLEGRRIGGVNVFGGGLALYKDIDGVNRKVGAIGVSGDTACRDHAFAWQIRTALGMHPFNNGVSLGNIGGVIGGAGAASGTGITTYNIDKDGNVQAAPGAGIPSPVGGVNGDELILESGNNNYYNNTWSHPVCVGSIKNIQPGLPIPSVNVDTLANGIVHAP
jgi:hypothetical protein